MKRKRHYKAKSVGRGGQINHTVSARKTRARPIEQPETGLDGWVSDPAKLLLYTAVFLAGCFLIKWLF